MNNSTPTTIQNIRLFLIQPSPLNPRKTIDKESLKELAANIEKQGLLQPITVRPVDYDVINHDGSTKGVEYEIVCGERRYRACSLLALDTIPCIVRPMTDEEALDAMITENLQRRDVDPVEEAEAFCILAERGQTVDDLATRFGKSAAYVRDRMKLTALIDPLRKALSLQTITLRGAVLLSRLSADDQQQFIEDEFDRDLSDIDCRLSTDDVEEWLDRFFRNIKKAPFQDGKTLNEDWNPDGALIRRCDCCECNTNNHGCLFADMKPTDPQCTDERCFERKTDIFYDNAISQYHDRIVREGQPAVTGQVAIVAIEPYMAEAKKRYDELIEKMKAQDYRIFTEKELSIYYGTPDELLKKGELIEGICLRDIASRYRNDIIHYYRILPAASGSSTSETDNLPARLASQAVTIEQKAETKIANYAKKNFDKEAYVSQKHMLEDWEENILWAIVFEAVDYLDQNELMPDTRYTTRNYQQMRTFRQNLYKTAQGDNRAWMRRAIANFVKKSYHESFLEELLKQSSTEHAAHIAEIRVDARSRIDSIHQELHEMGYDENGKLL